MKKILIIAAAVSALACAPALAAGPHGGPGHGGGFPGHGGGFQHSGGGHGGWGGGRGMGIGLGLGAAGIGLGIMGAEQCPARFMGYSMDGSPVYRRQCYNNY